jgi:hypothetical protein
MVPQSLLSEKDYSNLLHSLLNHPSPSDFLRACEAEYLPTNQDFYKLLLREVRREIGKRMGELNDFLCLPGNRGFDYKEARRMFIDPKIEEIKALVEGRVSALAAKPDWRPVFKERLLAFLLSEAERHLKKDKDEFSGAMRLANKTGEAAHRAFLDMETRLNNDPQHQRFWLLRQRHGGLEQFAALKIDKHLMFIQEEPEHIYGAANRIEIGEDYRTFMHGLKEDARLEVLRAASFVPKPETEFFESTEAMEKALAAARYAGLINEAGKWCFTGHRTHAVSLFWIAAIAAGLAKSSAPVSKVSPFLAALFNVPLGVNAVNKKKKAEDYDLGTDDTVFQKLYNELLTQMGKIRP